MVTTQVPRSTSFRAACPEFTLPAPPVPSAVEGNVAEGSLPKGIVEGSRGISVYGEARAWSPLGVSGYRGGAGEES